MKPFSPSEALQSKVHSIPSFVIEAVNTLLAQRFSGSNYVIIKQGELIELALKIGSDADALPDGTTRQTFFDNHWLDIEEVYKKEGWNVSFDKPAYCETYEAFWRFSSDERAQRFDSVMVDMR